MEVLSVMARDFLFVCTNVSMLLCFMDRMLERKRSFKVCIVFTIFKVLIINELFLYVLVEEIHRKGILQNVYLCASAIISIALYFCCFYTFSDEPVKIMVVSAISEIIDVVVGSSFNIITNVLNGRPPMANYVPFQMYDLLFPVLFIIIVPIVCKVLEPFFRVIRKWEIKHKRIWLSIMIMYVFAAIHSTFAGYQQGTLEMYFLVVCIVGCILWGYGQLYYRKAALEKEYLQKQQRFSKLQYSAIALQVERMEQAQREINEQMQKIMAISDDIVQRTEVVECFIQGLKQQSQVVMQGMFCDSWFVDSVLCHQIEKCRERDIKVDFQLQGYKKGEIREEDLAELINYLLESVLGEQDIGWISLHVASVKRQLVLDFKCDAKRIRISKRKMRKYTKQYQIVCNLRIGVTQ